MCVATGAGGDSEFGGKLGGTAIEAGERCLRVQHLDDIDQFGLSQLVERSLGEVSSHRVERVRNVDHSPLIANRHGGLDMAHSHRNSVGQKQSDDFASGRP